MTIIVLDPGHGGKTDLLGSSANNARGPRGTLEKDLTLQVALATREVLSGHHVRLTRDADVNLSAADRARVARDAGAAVFVSIHFNGFRDPTVQGTETLVRPADQERPSLDTVPGHCLSLARSVQGSLVNTLGLRDRGLKPGRWAVLSDALHSPAVARCLAEVSFLSDPQEEERLLDHSYKSRIARALAAGIRGYLQSAATESQALMATFGGGQRLVAGHGGYDPDGYNASFSGSPSSGSNYGASRFGAHPQQAWTGYAPFGSPSSESLSGAHWRKKADDNGWTNSVSVESLSPDFKPKVKAFMKALTNAGADYAVSSTRRHEVRAWLMHHAWEIWQGSPAPSHDPHGTGIVWDHGNVDATREAARQMKEAFKMDHSAETTSLHISGDAIDWTITWTGDLMIAKQDGTRVKITSTPRHGGKKLADGTKERGNLDLHAVGASYGVHKLLEDPPHWSATGH